MLTVASGMAGYTAAAEAALSHLLRAQPNLSLASIATNMPIREEAERNHYLEDFRRAGLT